MRTTDKRVLAKPFSEKGIIISTTAGGIKFVGNYDHLVKSEVIADGPDGIKIGDTVYVQGTAIKQLWAKTIYDVGNGILGVLVPIEFIVLVDDNATTDKK